ncbi:MAG: hypothetical protein J2P52_07040 [Blastocatellia bacterium]|nr:hypothetical protein [Blastocatellia bacterium]
MRTTKDNGDIPGHNFSMTIKKNGDEKSIVEYDSRNIPRELFLKVIDQSSSVGIELYTPELFTRKIRNDNNHFKWTLDIGSGELHSGPVDINHRALRSVLRVTGVESALFYTDKLSSDQLEVKIRHDERKIGYIAGSIEALIPLPQGGAVFSAGHGGKTIRLDPKEDVTYDVIIRQVCESDEACSKADVKEIFRDLFSIRKPGEEIEIIGLPHMRTQSSNAEDLQGGISPMFNAEVGCVGVNFSANNELP